MILQYDICSECAPVVMYGETTPDTPEDVIAFIESHGPLALVGEADPGAGGYWGCEACQMVTIGAGVVMELVI